jgi:MoaA/NifB/PqqE/SkfB family radical SAM enzyme
LKSTTDAREISRLAFFNLAKHFRELGAIKLSLLGGEPSLYGSTMENTKGIGDLVTLAKEIGYEYVRMVTNGLFDVSLLSNSGMRQLDELTFSIDGCTADIHDRERGNGTFVKTEKSIINAVQAGYKVQLTVCVHRGNIGYTDTGRLWIDEIMRWGEKVGAHYINFHPIIKMDVAEDKWTRFTSISVQDWKSVYKVINQNSMTGRYKIKIRLPLRFIDEDAFWKKSKYYGYCPVKLAERVIVHARGSINICALHNVTNISLAKYWEDGNSLKIKWNEYENELTSYKFDFQNDHSCAVIGLKHGNDLPLCISFKPLQNEFIWNSMGMEISDCS